MKMILRYFVALAGLYVAGSAHAGDYEYHLRNVPIADKDCPAKAEELSARFAQMTGLNAYAASCSREFRDLEIKIRYSAEKPVQVVSTGAPNRYLGVDLGTYKTQADCQAALKAEGEVLTQQTGYEVFTAYCFQEEYSSIPWVARVDGLGRGEPRKLVYADSASIFGKVLSPEPAMLGDKMRAAYAAKGAYLRSAIVNPGMTSGQIAVTYYYDNDPVRRGDMSLRTQFNGNYLHVDNCKFEQAIADAAMVNTQLVANVCVSKLTTQGVELQTVTYVDHQFKSYATTDRWASHEDCHKGRNAVIERLRNSGRDRLVTVLCTYQDKSWLAQAIER